MQQITKHHSMPQFCMVSLWQYPSHCHQQVTQKGHAAKFTCSRHQHGKFYWGLKQTTQRNPEVSSPPLSSFSTHSVHCTCLHTAQYTINTQQLQVSLPTWCLKSTSAFQFESTTMAHSSCLKMERTSSSLLWIMQGFFLWITSNNSHLGFTTYTTTNKAVSLHLKGT